MGLNLSLLEQYKRFIIMPLGLETLRHEGTKKSNAYFHKLSRFGHIIQLLWLSVLNHKGRLGHRGKKRERKKKVDV
jgi:hypothetical protein